MDLKGKKLLILGGDAASIDIVDAARSLGVYTIVTDWYDTRRSPAKLVADEFWNDSIRDTDVLIRRIKENGIEGIITGYTDSYLLSYQHLCELSGLPSYASKEVFELTMDKSRFKNLCRMNGIPVIPEYELDSFDPRVISKDNKVIIKPVDNSGSRGVILCESAQDFQKCLDYALSYSEKKKVVIEKYMEMESISISYTIQDGRISLSTTDDRHVHKSQGGSAVTNFGIYPSKYAQPYREKIDGLLREMYRKIGVKNGVISIQFFTNGDEFYVIEMGHRLTGGQHYTYTMMENGISVLDCLIHFALTGKMADYNISERDNAAFNHTYCHLVLLGKPGIIARFEGIDYVKQMPELMHYTQIRDVGDVIGADGTAAQKVVGLHLKVKDRYDLLRVFNEIKSHLFFYDKDGNDLTLDFNRDIL